MGDFVGIVGITVRDMSLGLCMRLGSRRIRVVLVFIRGIEAEIVLGNMLVVTLCHPAQERGEKGDEVVQLAAWHDIQRWGGKNGSTTNKRICMELNILRSERYMCGRKVHSWAL